MSSPIPMATVVAMGFPPALVDTAVNLAGGHSEPMGNLVSLWVDERHVEVVDEVYAREADADLCMDCGAFVVATAAVYTCEGEAFCPECWEDFPRPCHHPEHQ